MPDPFVIPCILVVADSERSDELVSALSEPLPTAAVNEVEVVLSSGGDDAIDLFESRRPHVVVLTATLEAGDAVSLLGALRGRSPRSEVGVVVVGDAEGPIRTAHDASELKPDQFVARPLSGRTLRFAIASALESVLAIRGATEPVRTTTSPGTDPGTAATAAPIQPEPDVATRAPNKASNEASNAVSNEGRNAAPNEASNGTPHESQRNLQRARWEALADSLVDPDDEVRVAQEEPPALPPPIIIRPRRPPDSDNVAPNDETAQSWKPGTTALLEPWAEPQSPTREPTLIIREPEDGVSTPRTLTDDVGPTLTVQRSPTTDPPRSRTRTGDGRVDMAERARPGGLWSDPMPLAELLDRDSRNELGEDPASAHDELGLPLADFDDDELLVETTTRPRDTVVLDDLTDAAFEPRRGAEAITGASAAFEPRRGEEAITGVSATLEPPAAIVPMSDGRDFARQLRAKMSMMAQRLFQGGDAATPNNVEVGPRHDHHTEIDLASLGEETPLGGGHTEIESRHSQRIAEARELTSPGSWDTHVRERGLPDAGELVRGVSDAAMVLAKMFASGATGRVVFRREPIETVVYFDAGRPVFASSSEPRDRMGELLVREGKITASQYERCQTVVAESGRRMGEILVDLGYLKRRELLPAVRRHVEDIVYALFGWDRGQYQISLDAEPSAERIRLSRHPAALVLEGIRRKLDRTSLERLVGPPSTVIEVSDRERLGGIISTGDLAPEERAALAAIDGQADLAQVARVAGVDIADVLPLGWGLCVLGLATARRTDTEIPDESTALVGETDLAIDRERVRARWQLVTDADYFALLGVRRDATTFEIRRAYQSARRDFAVDSFPADLRRELAQELDDIANVLDEAFRVLREDRLRVTYLAHLVE